MKCSSSRNTSEEYNNSYLKKKKMKMKNLSHLSTNASDLIHSLDFFGIFLKVKEKIYYRLKKE